MLNTSNKLPATQTQAALNAAEAHSIGALEENFAAVSVPSRPTFMGSMRSKVSTFFKGMFSHKHSSEDRQEAALLSSSVATTEIGVAQGDAGAVSTKAQRVAIASVGASSAAVAGARATCATGACAHAAVGGGVSKRMATVESAFSQSAQRDEDTETVAATVVDLDAEPSLLRTQPHSVGYALSFDEYMQESRDYIQEIRSSKIWHACGGDCCSYVPALPDKSIKQQLSLQEIADGVRNTNSSGAGAVVSNAAQFGGPQAGIGGAQAGVGCANAGVVGASAVGSAGAVGAMRGNYPQMYQEVTTATGQSYLAPVYSLSNMSSTDNSVIGQRMIHPQFISYTGRYRAYQVLSDAQICALNISKVDIIKRMLAGDASSKEMACFLDPMILAMTRVCNVLPASETNHDNGPCGLVEHNLKTAIYSLNSFLRFDPQQVTGVETKVSMNNGRWVTKKTPAKSTDAKAQEDDAIVSDSWDGSDDDDDDIIGDCETMDEMELAADDDDADDVDSDDASDAAEDGADTYDSAAGGDGAAAAASAAKGSKRGRKQSSAHTNPLLAYEEQDKKYGDIVVEDVSEAIWMRLNPYNYATNTGKRRVFGSAKMKDWAKANAGNGAGTDASAAGACDGASGANAAKSVGAEGIAYEDLMAMGQGASLELDKESAPPASLASAVAALAAETLLEADEDLIIADESVVSEVVATGETPFKDWNGSEDDEPPTKAKATAAAKGKAGAKSKVTAAEKAAAEARRKQAELKKTLRVRLDTMSDDGLGLLGLNTRNLRIKSQLDKVDSADLSLFFENNYLPNINVKQLIKEHNEAKELAAKQAAELAAKQAAEAAAKAAAELAAQQAAEAAAKAAADAATADAEDAALAQREAEEASATVAVSTTDAAATAGAVSETAAPMTAADESDDEVTDAALRAQSLESLAQREDGEECSDLGYQSLIDLAGFKPISLEAQKAETNTEHNKQWNECNEDIAAHASAVSQTAVLDTNAASASTEMESAQSTDSSVQSEATAASTTVGSEEAVASAVEQSEGIEEEANASDKAKADAIASEAVESSVELSEIVVTAKTQSAPIAATTDAPIPASTSSTTANESAGSSVADESTSAVAADATSADEALATESCESDASATAATTSEAHEYCRETEAVAKPAEQVVEPAITAESVEADAAVASPSQAKQEADVVTDSNAANEVVASTSAEEVATAKANAVTEDMADVAAAAVSDTAKSEAKSSNAKAKTKGKRKSKAKAAVDKSKASASEEVATETKTQSAPAQEPTAVDAVAQTDATTVLSAVADVSAANEAVVDADAVAEAATESETAATATQSVDQGADEQNQAASNLSDASAQADTSTKAEAQDATTSVAAEADADAIAKADTATKTGAHDVSTSVDAKTESVAAAVADVADASKDETAKGVVAADADACADAAVAVAATAKPANEPDSADSVAESDEAVAESVAVAADMSGAAQGEKSKGAGTSARAKTSKSKKASKKDRKAAHQGSGKSKAGNAQPPVVLGADGLPIKRGPGRPKGSKSQKTLERERLEAIALLLLEQRPEEAEALIAKVTPKPKPNAAAKADQQGADGQPVKRGRGRPKGSKSQKTLEREHIDALIGALAKFPKKAKTLAAQCKKAVADVSASAEVNSEAEISPAQAQEDLKP